MDKYKRLGKNTVLVFIGNGGSKLISLFMLPFYTRWLSVEEYGVADIINVYVVLLLGITTACIADAIFVFPKGQSFERQKAYFSSGLIFSFFSLGLTAILFKVILIVFYYKNISNSFSDNAWFVFFLLISMFLQQYIQQFVRCIDKMKIYSTTGIVLTICTALFSFVMIPRWNIFGYVFALIFANISAALFSLFFSGAFRYFSLRIFGKNTCAEMIKYSVALIPNAVMGWIIGAFNRPLMEYHLDMHAVGIFGVASRFSGILTALFHIFALSWQISVLEEFFKEGYSQFYNKMFKLVMSVLVLLSLIITASSKLIVTIFVSQDFYSAWRYIPVLTFGVIFSSISYFVGSNFAAAKQSRYFLYSSLWVITISLVCNIILIPQFGILGASVSVVISFGAMAVSRIIYAWKYVRIKNIMHYILMLFLGIAMILTVLYIKNIILKSSCIILIFVCFFILNHELRYDVKALYNMVKLARYKTNDEK